MLLQVSTLYFRYFSLHLYFSHLFFITSLSLTVCRSLSLSLSLSIYLSIYPSIHLSIYLSIFLSKRGWSGYTISTGQRLVSRFWWTSYSGKRFFIMLLWVIRTFIFEFIYFSFHYYYFIFFTYILLDMKFDLVMCAILPSTKSHRMLC